jgi:transketolase
MTDNNQNLRQCFAQILLTSMRRNRKIIIVTGDIGYHVWDDLRREFAGRFINVGSGEQALIGISVGLALKGFIPIAYSITPFLLYRPFETIRNYIDHESIPVKLIGTGRDRDYRHDGFSHWAQEDRNVMKLFKNITSCWPETTEDVARITPKMLSDGKPWYINLKR